MAPGSPFHDPAGHTDPFSIKSRMQNGLVPVWDYSRERVRWHLPIDAREIIYTGGGCLATVDLRGPMTPKPSTKPPAATGEAPPLPAPGASPRQGAGWLDKDGPQPAQTAEWLDAAGEEPKKAPGAGPSEPAPETTPDEPIATG